MIIKIESSTNLVFSEKPRFDKDFANYSESIYSFLDRSGLPIANNVRGLLETWFANYPLDGRNQLRLRLQSTNHDEWLCPPVEEIKSRKKKRNSYEIIKELDERFGPDFTE